MADTAIRLGRIESMLIAAIEIMWPRLDVKQRAYADVLAWILVEASGQRWVADAVFVATHFVHTRQIPGDA